MKPVGQWGWGAPFELGPPQRRKAVCRKGGRNLGAESQRKGNRGQGKGGGRDEGGEDRRGALGAPWGRGSARLGRSARAPQPPRRPHSPGSAVPPFSLGPRRVGRVRGKFLEHSPPGVPPSPQTRTGSSRRKRPQPVRGMSPAPPSPGARASRRDSGSAPRTGPGRRGRRDRPPGSPHPRPTQTSPPLASLPCLLGERNVPKKGRECRGASTSARSLCGPRKELGSSGGLRGLDRKPRGLAHSDPV